jgi:hypothetical protein
MRATTDGPATGSAAELGRWGRRRPAPPPPCGSRSYHTDERPILGLRRGIPGPDSAPDSAPDSLPDQCQIGLPIQRQIQPQTSRQVPLQIQRQISPRRPQEPVRLSDVSAETSLPAGSSTAGSFTAESCAAGSFAAGGRSAPCRFRSAPHSPPARANPIRATVAFQFLSFSILEPT